MLQSLARHTFCWQAAGQSHLELVCNERSSMILQHVEQLSVFDTGHLQHLSCSVAEVPLVKGLKKRPAHNLDSHFCWGCW